MSTKQILIDEDKLKLALEKYMSAFGQALEAHGIPFQEQQIMADRQAREALAQSQSDVKQSVSVEQSVSVSAKHVGEPVAATDIQISYEAHAEDPLDWNDLNFKECWHKGFADGFKAAETFHKIGVSQ